MCEAVADVVSERSQPLHFLPQHAIEGYSRLEQAHVAIGQTDLAADLARQGGKLLVVWSYGELLLPGVEHGVLLSVDSSEHF